MEKILCAAIWYNDGKTYPHQPINLIEGNGYVLSGIRHANIIATRFALTGLKGSGTEQGFLTSKNRFLNREEAAKLHIANGGKLNYSSTELYSEDLY